MSPDNRKKQLINELEVDCRQSKITLSQKIGVDRNTVARLIRKMKEKGEINSFTLSMDYSKLGYQQYMMIWLKIQTDKVKSVFDEVSQLEEVHMTIVLAGPYDGLIFAVFKDRNTFYDFIFKKLSKIKGIVSFETDLILARYYRGQKIGLTRQKDTIPLNDLDWRIISVLKKIASIVIIR